MSKFANLNLLIVFAYFSLRLTAVHGDIVLNGNVLHAWSNACKNRTSASTRLIRHVLLCVKLTAKEPSKCRIAKLLLRCPVKENTSNQTKPSTRKLSRRGPSQVPPSPPNQPKTRPGLLASMTKNPWSLVAEYQKKMNLPKGMKLSRRSPVQSAIFKKAIICVPLSNSPSNRKTNSRQSSCHFISGTGSASRGSTSIRVREASDFPLASQTRAALSRISGESSIIADPGSFTHILPYPFPRSPKRGLSSSVRRKLSTAAQRRSLVESIVKRLKPICCRYHITCPRQRRQARYGLSEALQDVNEIWAGTKTKGKRFKLQQARRICCAFNKPCPAGE